MPRWGELPRRTAFERGRYLASIVCAECHGLDFHGNALEGGPSLAVLAAWVVIFSWIAVRPDPAELWQTAYGRSILYKVALLVPIGALALYNRRIIVALRDVARPNGPTLALVRRMAGAELALSLVIVVVASILVAQVPPVG